MAESPFLASANTNTTKQGSIWTVLVQPSFSDLVFEASALITKGLPNNQNSSNPGGVPKTSNNQPSEFSIRIRESAQALAGTTATGENNKDDGNNEEFDQNESGLDNNRNREQAIETVEVKEKKRQIVQEVWSKLQPGILTKTDDKELEATINLLLTLLSSFFPSDHPKFYGFASQIMEVIVTAEGKTTSYGRYSALFTLFNSLPIPTEVSDNQPPLQLTIFSRLVDMTSNHPEDLSILLPSLLRLPSYLNQWNMLSSRTSIGVIEKVLRLFEKAGKPVDAFNLSVGYLSYPELIQVDLSSGLDQIAEICVSLALSLPDFYDWDLLGDISPVSRFLGSHKEGQPRYNNLIKLLKNPTTRFEEVEKELKSNGQLSKVISEDVKSKIQRKARLLSLTELCGSRLGSEVKYSEVKECLGLATPIEEDDGMEVEEWVINAVKAKLITARLHQPSQVVFITKAAHRSFGKSQWELLQNRLESWGQSIKHLNQIVDESLISLENNNNNNNNNNSNNNNNYRSGREGSGNDGNKGSQNKQFVTASA